MRRATIPVLWVSLLLTGVAQADQELRISFLPVTWGDAVLYQGPCGEVGLIDGSYAAKNIPVVRDAIAASGGELAWIAVSHYDQDHLGNVHALGDQFRVPIVFDRGGERNAKRSDPYEDYFKWADPPGSPVRNSLTAGDTFSLCGNTTSEVTFTVLSAAVGRRLSVIGDTQKAMNVPAENDKGLCLKITYREFDLATCGDIGGYRSGEQRDVETTIAALMGDVEVAKVNHHGSRYSSNATWVQALSAQASVIVGARAQYKHPSPAVLGRWSDEGAVFEAVDSTGRPRDGTVTVSTDGVDGFTVRTSDTNLVRSFPMDGSTAPNLQETEGQPAVRDNDDHLGALLVGLASGALLIIVGATLGHILASASTRRQTPEPSQSPSGSDPVMARTLLDALAATKRPRSRQVVEGNPPLLPPSVVEEQDPWGSVAEIVATLRENADPDIAAVAATAADSLEVSRTGSQQAGRPDTDSTRVELEILQLAALLLTPGTTASSAGRIT